ncbi:RNA polymerase sigma factor [Belliella marina]|uniref:RNA polymerase sigma factor n=1 Tax=Belliella marina TaxID=1644146 RepID=A0ABW4VPD2_9BACT
MKSVDFDDIVHWKKIIEGDIDSYKFFYEKYVDDLFSYGKKFLSDEEEVKDAIHDLFIDLYSYKSKLSKDITVKYYLLFSLKNKIIANTKKKAFSLRFQHDIPGNVDLNQEEKCINKESDAALLKRMHLELDKLPDRQKEAVYLKYSQNLTYEEIARLMGVNTATCRTLIYRSIKQLRKSLNEIPLSTNFEFAFK